MALAKAADTHAVRSAIYALGLALGTTYVFMYRFSAAYDTPLIHDLDDFASHFTRGIFSYRILATQLVLWLNDVLFDGRGLYHTRSLVIGMSTACFNFSILALLRRLRIRAELHLPMILLMDLIIGMTLYIRGSVYTVPALALIYVAVLCAELRAFRMLLLAVLLGALTHEISVLAVVYVVSKSYWSPREPRRDRGWAIACLFTWVAVYAGLRVAVPAEAGHVVFHAFQLWSNLRVHALAGFGVTVLLFVVLIRADALREAARMGYAPMLAFTSVAIPYALFVLFFAKLDQMRIFVHFFPMLIILYVVTLPWCREPSARLGASDPRPV
jgi:hypothetical protein